MPKTSITHPIRVDWIVDDLAGKVGLTLAPGKHGTSKVDRGAWARDLHADLDALVAHGMHTQVCLLEDHELESLKIPRLVEEAQRRKIAVVRLPIPDGGVLPDVNDVRDLVVDILDAAHAGNNVVIHCMGGLGRAGTIGGCVLVAHGLHVDDALARLRERRGDHCPETEAQRMFIRAFARIARAEGLRSDRRRPSF